MCIHILNILTGIMYMFYGLFTGSLLFKEKIKFNKNYFLAILIYLISFFLRTYYFSSAFNIFFDYIILVILYMLIFRCEMFKILVVSAISYTFYNVGKFIFLLVVNIFNINLSKNLITIIGMIVIFVAFIGLTLLKNRLLRLSGIIRKHKKKHIIIFGILFFNFFISFLAVYADIELNNKLGIDFIIMFMVVGISIYNVKREAETKSLVKFYEEMCEYSKINEELVMDYRMAVHENKNKLIIIKNMLKGEKKDLVKYVDSLIDEKINIKNSFLSDLKSIPLPGVKNFINYKLMRMRDLGAHIELVISEDIEHIDITSLNIEQQKDLYTVLGVILDNMIESLQEQNDKLVSIHMYLDNDSLHCEFVNSFLGKMDLEKIKLVGYSTKGKERGVGLSLVDNIVKTNDWIEVKSEIIDKFFIQHVYIIYN